MKSFQSNKCFSLIVISINGNDILCAMYLGCVWIADLTFGDSFKVKEESWRSGIFCITAFTIVFCFTILTENLLILLSLTRLLVVIYPMNSRFKKSSFVAKLLVIVTGFSLLVSFIVGITVKSTNISMTINLCLPFLDPSNSQIIVKLIVWFTVVTQMATSVGIAIMHCLLFTKLRQSQYEIQKSKTDKNLPLAIQLIMITVLNILCWLPTGCVYISAMFLANYPIDLAIWTTVIGLPINSIINPFVFIVTTVRKMIQFEK